jgi:two-component system chemotaxis response regulator CheB
MQGRVIAIGASADGIAAIATVLRSLPGDLAAPVFVVQHLGRTSLGFLPEILARASPLPVRHPAQGDLIVSGRVYVAPPDHHLVVDMGRTYLSRGPRENHARPAVDALFRSVALAYGSAAVGVVLTGYLSDGTVGLLAIKDRGGVAIVQDPLEAAARGMPTSALASAPIDHTLRLAGIGPKLVELVADAPAAPVLATRMLELENRIAAGLATPAELTELLRAATPTTRWCSLCGKPLYRLPERRVARYRCASGHAFTDATVTDRLESDTARVASWT